LSIVFLKKMGVKVKEDLEKIWGFLCIKGETTVYRGIRDGDQSVP